MESTETSPLISTTILHSRQSGTRKWIGLSVFLIACLSLMMIYILFSVKLSPTTQSFTSIPPLSKTKSFSSISPLAETKSFSSITPLSEDKSFTYVSQISETPTATTLSVFNLMVWGSPASFGTKDKGGRIEAIGKFLSNSPEFDVFLLTDLWMRPDHDELKNAIPEGYDITTVEDLSASSCDGIIAPEFCSGLAIVSKLPFLAVEFTAYNEHGDFFWDYEYFLRRGVARVRLELSDGSKTADIFVT